MAKLISFKVLPGAVALHWRPNSMAESTRSAQQRNRGALQSWMAGFNAGDSRPGMRSLCLRYDRQLPGSARARSRHAAQALARFPEQKSKKVPLFPPNQGAPGSGGLAAVRLVWTLGIVAKNG